MTIFWIYLIINRYLDIFFFYNRNRPGKSPSASYSHVKFESTLIGVRVVVDFFLFLHASAASVANRVTKLNLLSLIL